MPKPKQAKPGTGKKKPVDKRKYYKKVNKSNAPRKRGK